jgi:hypothetical protein
MRAGPATVEALELVDPSSSPPPELAQGPARFRHRALRIAEARVRLPLAKLARDMGGAGLTLSLTAAETADAVHLCVEDRGRSQPAVATRLHLRGDGTSLLLTPTELRSIEDGPRSPWAALCSVALGFGLPFDPEAAAFRAERVLRSLLLAPFVERGWRAPDDRALELAARMDEGELELVGTRTVDGEAAEAQESLRRGLGRALAAFAGGRLDEADVWLARASDRAPGPDAKRSIVGWEHALWLERRARSASGLEPGSFGFDDPELERMPAPLVAGTLREALRAGDAETAGRTALRFASEEPCDLLAGRALLRAALIHPDPGSAQGLLQRAVLRRPEDEATVSWWIAGAGPEPDPNAAATAARRVLATGLDPTLRGRAAARAVEALAAAGQPAVELALEARLLAPGDPAIMKAEARAREAGGELRQAALLFERAAERAEAGASEAGGSVPAELRLAAAGAYRAAGLDAAAERVLTGPGAETTPAAQRLLATICRERGAFSAARTAYASLLSFEDGSELVPALRDAARFHLVHAEPDAARAFTERLARLARERDAVSAESWAESWTAEQAGELFADPASLAEASLDGLLRAAQVVPSPAAAAEASLDAAAHAEDGSRFLWAALAVARRGGSGLFDRIAARAAAVNRWPHDTALRVEIESAGKPARDPGVTQQGDAP